MKPLFRSTCSPTLKSPRAKFAAIMDEGGTMIVFGPVPSRRLGRSLGINNIPPKLCSYSCVYCQIGRTRNIEIRRRNFYEPSQILCKVTERVRKIREQGEKIDYLTFVPDGEPTLDRNLGNSIDLLRPLGIKIAVITNASLIWREDVQRDLARADWVSVKVDSTLESTWRKVARPHKAIELDAVLSGVLEFGSRFTGDLSTETMLVRGLNDGEDHVEAVAAYVSRLAPRTAYISIPTRPPAERSVHPPDEAVVNRACQIFRRHISRVEHLTGYEGDAFAHTGNFKHDLLSITAVHPMRENAVAALLADSGGNWSEVRALVTNGSLLETHYEGATYYVRRFPPMHTVTPEHGS